MAKKYTAVLEPDAGLGSRLGLAQAAGTPAREFAGREDVRAGLQELDEMTERDPRWSRAQKDRARIHPRDASAALNRATKTRVPEYDELRTAISGRQMKARRKVLSDVQRRWTKAQAREIRAITHDPDTWARITDHLSAHVGDPDTLSAGDQLTVQRLDRAIRSFEQSNDRLHHVYAQVSLPPDTRLEDYEIPPQLHLDRWTAATHNLHELTSPEHTEAPYVMEITTRRGMYMGHSDGGSSTGHLLPRAMSFEVDRVYEARWTAPDGSTGSRRVIRLREINEENK